jgi:serine/threonine protein kinase/predicted negative regulator of RcsB-dependent stress response
MAADKWSQVKYILDAAIQRKPEERAAFLDEACGADKTVRREVDSLLSSFGRADGFMQSPAVEAPTIKLESFAAGHTIGRYEIVSLLGRGGMGEVFLAKDRQLRRNVAIKVLPETVAADQERLHRFEQEAIAASALNHPNILTIHEIGEVDGVHYIVSEYIAGRTLRDQMATISVSDALDATVQILSALKAAHNSGIVHRDIKPENIMVRDDGLVKVLDFGLAKLTEDKLLLDADAATMAHVQTRPGMIMGTVTYMSPEQARGLEVDHRSDIWSVGVVLYEMLCRRRPFTGATAVDTLASILEKEPPALPSNAVSNGTASIVTKALEKQVENRYQTSDEMLNDLRLVQRRREAKFVEDPAPNDRKTEILEPIATSRVRQWQVSTQLRFVLAASLAVLAIGSFAYYLSSRRSAVPQKIESSQNSPAYDLYVRGKVKVTNVNPDDNAAAIKLLEQAVALDPNYAEAWAALAKGYVFRSFNFAPGTEQKKLNEDAEVAVEKALEKNPDLPEGHLARGLVLWTHARRFPHEQAIQAFKRAIDLNPDFDEAHQWLSAVYVHIGLFDEASQEIKKTLGLNPSNTTVRLRMLAVNYYQGKYEEAISLFKTTPPDEFPANLYRMTADSLVHLDRLNEAGALIEEYLKKYPNDEGGNVTSVKAVILAKEGKQKEAEAIIQQSIDIGQGFGHFHHAAYNIASAYALMKKPDEALKWLQNAAEDGFPCYPYFEIDHHLDNIRSDARFMAFMSKLKEKWLKYKAEYEK